MPASMAASVRATPPTHVAENRARMAAALGVEPHRFLTAYRSTRRRSWSRETPWTPEARPRADAIVTRMRALAIGVRTADCGPVLLADPRARVIGAAHAGWRGALSGVVEATVDAMERLGAERERIRAVLGPMIRQPNYEVGPDLIARFAAEDPASDRFFAPAPRDGHALFDLAGYVAARLARAGVRQSRTSVCAPMRTRAVFQLPPRHAPCRSRLRPPHQRDRAGRPNSVCGKSIGHWPDSRNIASPLVYTANCWYCSKKPRDKAPDSCCQPLAATCIRSASSCARAQESGMAGNNGAIKLVAGNSNPVLAGAIGDYLGTR